MAAPTFKPASQYEVHAAVLAYLAERPNTAAADAAKDFARNRLPEATRRQLNADEAAFFAEWRDFTEHYGHPKTGSQDATERMNVHPVQFASWEIRAGFKPDHYYVWRVSPGGGQERHVCEVPNEEQGRRYIDWLNTHPNNRRSIVGTNRSPADRFELRLGTMTIYAPPLPDPSEVRSWTTREDVFPG